ncbi:MAG TPA: hypothetical protein VN903_40540 [Polyangia bacterium]|jgi:hypothetical protein|nr:hypothetical protein [Polyangia bacterium]
MLRRRLFALAPVLIGAVAVVAACAASKRDPRFPKRGPGCSLSIYHNLPEVKEWDDIGLVQVDCYLDESEVICLSRLRAEACRMGGDIIYNVPTKALRPVERGMIYRGNVAHTRIAKKQDDTPAATDAGSSSGPIEPLAPAAGAVVPIAPITDGGGQ